MPLAGNQVEARKQQRALRIGNFRLVDSDRFLAFERYTEQALETVVVVANPSGMTLTDRVMIANAGLMDATPMVDLLSPADAPPVGTVDAACMTETVPAETVMILVPREQALGGYSRYKRGIRHTG